MNTNAKNAEVSNKDLVLLNEDGSLTQLPWEAQAIFNDTVVIVELAFDWRSGVLSITSVTDVERARRCVALGEYETKEMLEEQDCSLRGLVETVLEYAFDEVPGRDAVRALCNALFADTSVRVAYYWEAE